MRRERLIGLLNREASNAFALFSLHQRRPHLVELLNRNGLTSQAEKVAALDLDTRAGIKAAATELQRVSETVMPGVVEERTALYDALSSAASAAYRISVGMATGELADIAGLAAARAAAYAADPGLGPKDQLTPEGLRIWHRAYREQRRWLLTRLS